jgi:oligopeptide transport system permease protein
MQKYILRRVGYMFFTLWVIITITFFLMNTLPGDPISAGAKQLPPQIQANLRAKWLLDKPIQYRYIAYIKNLIMGNLGESIKTPGLTANSVIKERFPASARLGLQAVFFGLVIGLLLGVIAAFKRGTGIDYFVMFIAIVGISVPSFVVALLLQKYLSGGSIPVIGWPSEHMWTSGFKYTILPTIALGLGGVAVYSRYMRASILDIVNQDYILTARSKGLSESTIIRRHILRNALLPIITIVGPSIAGIITGTFVIESIFVVPGLGRFYIESITNRDYTMIMATTIFFAFFYIVSLLVVDILYGVIDPRIRLPGKSR